MRPVALNLKLGCFMAIALVMCIFQHWPVLEEARDFTLHLISYGAECLRKMPVNKKEKRLTQTK